MRKKDNRQVRLARARRICSAISVAGFFILLGTAGASNLDTISESRILWQSIIGLTLLINGCSLTEKLEEGMKNGRLQNT